MSAFFSEKIAAHPILWIILVRYKRTQGVAKLVSFTAVLRVMPCFQKYKAQLPSQQLSKCLEKAQWTQ
jgi:hypothetical protein